MTSVVNSPITDSARALSCSSPRLPTEASTALRQPLCLVNGEVLQTTITVMHERRVDLAVVQGLLERIER